MQRWGAAGEMSAGYSQFRSAEVIRLRRGVPTIDVGGVQEPSVELLFGCPDETNTAVTLGP